MADGDGAATDLGSLGGPVQTTAPTQPAPPATISLTQADLDARMVARAEQAKRNERQALLDSLGFKSLKEAEELVKSHREAQEAQRTEVERAIATANETVANYNKQLADLTAERHSLNVERALHDAGATGKVARLVDVEVGADMDAIAAAVEATKAEFPSLFGAAIATPAPSEPSGGGAPSRPSPKPDALSRGEERAKARNPEVKRSFL